MPMPHQEYKGLPLSVKLHPYVVFLPTEEKNKREGRIIWVKAYQLTDAGKWFALLLAEEKELTAKEKAEILQSLFRTYVKMVQGLAEEIGINKRMLEEIFKQEMK